jgi:hypothetical protein
MLSVCVAANKELLRLRREILLTIKIRNPHFRQTEAFYKLISERIAAFSRAGVSERELTRMALAVAQRYIAELSTADVDA